MRLKTSEIRQPKLGDAHGVSAVHAVSWRYTYRGIIDGAQLERMINRRGPSWWATVIRRGGGMLVMEMGGKVVGYVTFGPNRLKDLAYRGEIYELYLLPEYHGLGFGRALFEAAHQLLKRRGFGSIAIRALADNLVATTFYAAMGGVEVARRMEVIGKTVLPVTVFGWERRQRRAA